MNNSQIKELYTLRKEKAWSWYELAERYGITCDEARKEYSTWQAHLDSWKPFCDEHSRVHPDFAWMNL